MSRMLFICTQRGCRRPLPLLVLLLAFTQLWLKGFRKNPSLPLGFFSNTATLRTSKLESRFSDLSTSPAPTFSGLTHVNPSVGGACLISSYINLVHVIHFHSLKFTCAMQDPRFCSVCGSGPFAKIQNHLNKCKEAKEHETDFMNSVHGIKWHGPVLENEIRKRWLLLNLDPQVWVFTGVQLSGNIS